MGAMQRRKGASGERELAKRLTKLLNDAGANLEPGALFRSQQFCGKGGHGDVMGLHGVHLESKRVEKGTATIYKWIDQAMRDALPGDVPMVCTRANLKAWLLIIELNDLVGLSRAIVSIVGMTDEEQPGTNTD